MDVKVGLNMRNSQSKPHVLVYDGGNELKVDSHAASAAAVTDYNRLSIQ